MAAFNLDPAPTFGADVPITRPELDAPALLPITFRHQSRDDLKAWVAGIAEKGDAASLHEVIVGWDASGPYSREALDKLLADFPPSANELIHGYLRALTESRAKN